MKPLRRGELISFSVKAEIGCGVAIVAQEVGGVAAIAEGVLWMAIFVMRPVAEAFVGELVGIFDAATFQRV